DPRTMPQRFLDMYDPDSIELPENYLPVHPFDNGELSVRDEKLAGLPRTESEVRRHIAEYYAMITHLDHEMGRVFETLEATGQLENTVVVFAGDNGLAVGQHGLMGKQSLYDHSVRVPLIMAGPGVPKNQRSDSLCYLLDIFPTLCDLLGLDTPDSVEGKSLKPCFDDPSATARDLVHLAYRHLMRGVSDGKHKLIEYAVDGHRRTQLFDLEQDPWETKDLIDHPDQGETVTRLRKEVEKWREELNDHWEPQGGVFWQTYDQPAG
ncbi:MAG: sulfatase-like hydrolase/transferase, partial [Phycisphaeraceae bacterium]